MKALRSQYVTPLNVPGGYRRRTFVAPASTGVPAPGSASLVVAVSVEPGGSSSVPFPGTGVPPPAALQAPIGRRA